VSKLSRASDYQTVFLDDSDHLQRVAQMYAQRAQRFSVLAIVTLSAAILLVFGGVVVFLLPTRFADLNEISELNQQLQVLKDKRESMEDTESTAEAEQAKAATLSDAYAVVCVLPKAIAAGVSPKAITTDASTFVWTQRAERVLSALANGTPVSVPTDEIAYNAHPIQNPTVELSSEMLKHEVAILQQQGADIDTALEHVRRLNESIRNKTPDTAPDAKLLQDSLQLFEIRYDEVFNDYKNTRARLNELSQEASERTVAKQRTRAEIEKTQAELSKTMSDPVLLWAPILTVRVGVVILLLFLTKILLATYRYTMSLSAFYRARCDVLQLVTKTKNDRLFNLKEFVQLIPLVSPDGLQIDAVASPDETLVRLAAKN
jgi:hypothetical protein